MTPPPLASEARAAAKSPIPTPTQRSKWSPRNENGASLELIAHSVDAAQRWRANKLADLGLKLAALQYRLPFDAQSADLVERLFGDLMTSVETNKKVMVELRSLKEKNIQLENALKERLLSQSETGVDEKRLQSRIFRLTRLSESLIFICSQLTSSEGSQADWSGASVSLLSLLLSYERQVEETTNSTTDESVKDFPPFIREFHSVWRAHEEKDELQSQLKEKDRQIADLLTGDTSTQSSLKMEHINVIEQHETNLLKAVESIKQKIDGIQTDMCPPSLLMDLQKWKSQVKVLEGEKKSQEEHIRRLEKRFANVLKKQQELEGMCRDSASPNCVSQRSTHSDEAISDEERTRKHRHFLRMINDREIDAFESAKEAWRHERLLLESQKEEKEKELHLMKRQISQMEDDMEEAAKKYSRILGQYDKANEALSFAQNRIEFFERTEVERQQAQGESIRKMQEMQRDLEEMRSQLREKENHLNQQSLQLDDVGRTLIANDAQLQSVLRERDTLVLRLKKATEELQDVSMMYATLQNEIHQLEQSRDLATEKLHTQNDDLEQHREEVELLHERLIHDGEEMEALKIEIDKMRLTLRKAGEIKHGLETQLNKAISERASYKQSAIDAREALQDTQDMYASLDSRYRALLLEMEGAEPQPEAGNLSSSIASMIPPTIWNARVEDKNEEIRCLYEQIETLHREVRAFRKSRDQAIKQKAIALDRLRAMEEEIHKLKNANKSLQSTTQVLSKRLRHYSQRIEVLDGIIAQQRNHILTHRMASVPEDEEGSASASTGKASAAVRYLLNRTQGTTTPLTISSRPLSDPFRISPISSVPPRTRNDPTPFPLKSGGEPITPISRQSKSSGVVDGTIPPEASEASGFMSPKEAPASTDLLWVNDFSLGEKRGNFEAEASISRVDDSSIGQRTARQFRRPATEEWSVGDHLDERTESVVDISSSDSDRHVDKSSPMSLSGSDIHRAQTYSDTAPGYMVDYRDDMDTSGTWRKLDQSGRLDSQSRQRDDHPRRLSQSRLDDPQWDENSFGQHSLMYSSRFSNVVNPDLTTSNTVADEESIWQLSETSGGKATVEKAVSLWDLSEDTRRT